MTAPFDSMAPLYDAIYAARGKDYAAEAAALHTLIERRRPGARTLLDVACGTGEHLRHLRARYDVAGVEPHPGMLRSARAKLPAVPIERAEMTDFDLGRRFDVVTCLFASIGYLPDEPALRAALARMAAHLAPDGLLILEPALFPEQVRPAEAQRDELTHGASRIVRLTTAERADDALLIDFAFTVTGADGPPRRFTERHRIALFPRAAYEAAFTAADLAALAEGGRLLGRPRSAGGIG